MQETKTKQDVNIDVSDSQQENHRLAVFEEIRQYDLTLTDPEKAKVPMAMVFGQGTAGNLQSFGGRTLNENALMVDKAIKNVGELENIWNHSHTQWIWKHINFSYHAPLKNMRQISAEISSKKAALNEAKWRKIKNEVKIRKIEEQLKNGVEDYWQEVDLKVKLAELLEGDVESIKYIEGAMKDVLAMQEMYEQLKSKVNSFNEEDVEREESKSHLKRSIVQCIRDVRQAGVISKGEQEYVEQIGVNPSKLQRVIQKYVKEEAEQDSWDSTGLFKFVDQLTEELTEIHKVDVKRMELQGFDHDYTPGISYTNTLALPKSANTDAASEE
jgi:hypothetical protein